MLLGLDVLCFLLVADHIVLAIYVQLDGALHRVVLGLRFVHDTLVVDLLVGFLHAFEVDVLVSLCLIGGPLVQRVLNHFGSVDTRGSLKVV